MFVHLNHCLWVHPLLTASGPEFEMYARGLQVLLLHSNEHLVVLVFNPIYHAFCQLEGW